MNDTMNGEDNSEDKTFTLKNSNDKVFTQNNSNEMIAEDNEKKVEFKVDVKRTILMGFGFLSCMLAWSYYNFKIPIILNGITGTAEGEWLRVGMLGTEHYMEIIGGAIMTLDNIIAILLQPYFGKLSDRMMSKFGRRTPFVIIGLPVAAFCLVVLPFTGIFGLFIAVIFVFNLAMSFYRPPVMSVLPDQTPPQVLSSANSFISLMGGLGVVVGMLIPKLADSMPNSTPTRTGVYETQDFFWQDFWGFFFTALFMLICLIIFIRSIKEVPTGEKFWEISETPIHVDVYTQRVIPKMDEQKSEDGKLHNKKGFFDDWNEITKDKDKSALYILLAVFFYLFGYNALEFSFGRFATGNFQIEEGTAGLLLAVMPVMLILTAIPAGRLAEKYGRLKIMKLGLIITGICTIIIMFITPMTRSILDERPIEFVDLVPLMMLLSIAGIGYGFTHINALPVVWQLSPKKKIGAYTGVYYMISALGGILSPLIMSSIYWFVREIGGNQWNALFPYYLVGLIIGFIFIAKTKHGDAEPLSPEELARLKSQYLQDD